MVITIGRKQFYYNDIIVAVSLEDDSIYFTQTSA
jgi:hypothetical protein